MEWNKLVPELVVADYRASRRFYTELLGFTLFFERTEDRFGYFDLDGAQIMLIEQPGGDLYGLRPDTEKGRGLHLQIEVERIAPQLQALQRAGVALAAPVAEAWYRADDIEHGQREFFVSDPDGYLLRFFEYIGERFLSA
jgi:catechol 2,3-dioxygenase-like lactoylglutathione lyase family enzyme